jgi:hypothetical protein
MSWYVLQYEVVDDYLERRPAFREEHLALANTARDRGELVMAGAFDPPEGALLVFRTDDSSIPERFANEDPYVRNGLVTSWRVRRWAVVIE